MKFILPILLLILVSCDNSKEITITDFSEPVEMAIWINPDKSYTTKLMKVSGKVDDSVSVKICAECYNHYLVGKIDTLFRLDFYGSTGRDSTYFYFDPYKAKSGELKLTYSIR